MKKKEDLKNTKVRKLSRRKRVKKKKEKMKKTKEEGKLIRRKN